MSFRDHARRKDWARAAHIGNTNIPILQYDLSGALIREHPSIGIAARSTKCEQANVKRALHLGSTSGGFIWRYKGIRVREQLTDAEVEAATRGAGKKKTAR